MRKTFWLLPLLVAIPALAVIPQFWEVRTYDELRQGELEGLSVTSEGELVLAPRFDPLFDTGEPLVFSMVADSKGVLYLGTGHDGRVFRVDADGSGVIAAELPELDVLSLAVDSADRIYAATSPNGKIYRLSDSDEPEVFFDPPVTYVWDMLFDPQGNLIVATGDEGAIFRVAPDGTGSVLYDSDETHIVALALDGNGELIAGGDPKGYVYRIGDDGRAFVLYDSGMREVHSLVAAGDGTVYAAVLDAAGSRLPSPAPASPGGGGTPTVTVTVGPENGSVAAVQAAEGAAQAAEDPQTGGSGGGTAAGARSTILEIRADGVVTPVWESNGEMVFSLLPRNGRLLFSTGTKGRIYAYDGPRRTTLLVESTEEQTTRLIAMGERVLAASSNAGKLFELRDETVPKGAYESIVKDTAAISSWGKAMWTGRGVEILTRTGNTGSPDSTWSDWSPLGPDGRVESPRARFVQWRAVLEADADSPPSLSALTLPYLQQNFRPRIHSVDVLPPGVSLQEVQSFNNNGAPAGGGSGGAISGRVTPSTQRMPPRRVVEKGSQALQWNASDQNDDTLLYSILYRAENEREWKHLAQGLDDNFYTINSDTLPDGMYVVRIVASDVGSNPTGLALTGEIETRPFAIDNTPPAVELTGGGIEDRRATVRAEVSDPTSTLKQAEMSVDGGVWRPVFPVDGIIDSTSEVFEFTTEALDSGEHVVAFRIYDQNDNVGMGKTIVRIP